MTNPARFLDVFRLQFGAAVQEHVALAAYTSARIGGPADIFVTVTSADELAEAMKIIWQYQMPFYLLGGGSNVLISEAGVRGVVILNRAKAVSFINGDPPTVWCEAGVIFSNLANRCAPKAFSGLEWAATIPGTVGGAVYGNAGAFGADMSDSLVWAEVLTQNGREKLTADQMQYAYRASILKRVEMKAIVLSALLRLKNASREEVSAKIKQFRERRKSTQPPGASMGSLFANPAGDYAGRLIEAAGLKGTRIGNAEISMKHGNFFINHGQACAEDIRALIRLTQQTVFKKFNINLKLEVELIGEWNVEHETFNVK